MRHYHRARNNTSTNNDVRVASRVFVQGISFLHFILFLLLLLLLSPSLLSLFHTFFCSKAEQRMDVLRETRRSVPFVELCMYLKTMRTFRGSYELLRFTGEFDWKRKLALCLFRDTFDEGGWWEVMYGGWLGSRSANFGWLFRSNDGR